MKSKLIIPCLFLLLFSSLTYAQTYVLTGVKDGTGVDKWGYYSLEGEVLIEPQYGICSDFSEDGIALVYYKKRNLYQLIDLKGRIIEVNIGKFEVHDINGFKAKGFNSGLLAVMIDDKWGCLNTKGELVIPLEYNYFSPFNNGFATAQLKNEFYVFDKKGNKTLVKTDDIKRIKPFSEGLAPFRAKNGDLGFINTSGEVVIAPKFKGAGVFSGGLAWARNEKGDIGFINKKGEWVVNPEYVGVKDYDAESGLARVKRKDGWGYVDKNGTFNAFEGFNLRDDFSEGLSRGVENGKFGFFNNKGEWVIKPQFDGAKDFKNGYAVVKMNDKWGVIDKKGNWILQPEYSRLNSVVIVKNN